MTVVQKTKHKFYLKILSTDDKTEFNSILLICRKWGLKFDPDVKAYTSSNPKILLETLHEINDNFETFVNNELVKEIEEYDPYIPSFQIKRKKLDKTFFEKFPPKGQYQVDDANRMFCAGRMMNLSKQGLGKTYETVQAVNQLFVSGEADRVLIVVIPVMAHNWRREFLMFSDLFKSEDFLIITEANREKIFEKDLPKIVITSYSTLRLCSDYKWKLDNPFKEPEDKEQLKEAKKKYREKQNNYRKEQIDFSTWGSRRVFVVDEAHKMKNMDARWTQIIHKEKKFFEYRYPLTGTPHPQGIHELYSLLKFLDDNLVDENYTEFLRTIGNVGTKYSDYALASIDEEKANKFLERIKPYFIRRFLRDVVDLPEAYHKPIYIELEGVQKNLYQQIVSAELQSIKEEKGIIRYQDVYVKFPYLSQALSDPCLLDGKLLNLYGMNKWKFEDSIKYKTTESLLTSIYEDNKHEKVVIWCEHPATIDRLGKALEKYNPILVHGSNTPKGEEKYSWRDKQIDEFRNNPERKILIANPTTLGTGTNLQFVQHVIYFDRSCDFVNYDQSVSRFERIGMVGEVTYYILIVDNSLDVHCDQVLANKEVLDRLFLKQGLTVKDCKDIFAGVKI